MPDWNWFQTTVAREPGAAESLEVWPAPCIVCWHERGKEFIANSRENGLAHRRERHPWLQTILDQMRKPKEAEMAEMGKEPEFESPPDKPVQKPRCPVGDGVHRFQATMAEDVTVIFCTACGETRRLMPPPADA